MFGRASGAGGKRTTVGRKGEGLDQGDPEAGPWFCIGWHPYLIELDAIIVAAGGKSLFGNDDGYIIGPGSVVFPALEKFAQQILENCLLRLQVSKTEVFSWEENLPEQAPQGMRRAGEVVDGEWEHGFMCYGMAVGSDKYVRNRLMAKVDEVTDQVNSVRKVLGPQKDLQAILAVLQCSLSQKLDWQLSLNYPSDVKEAAKKLDSELWRLLEFASSQHIPRAEEGMGVECILGAQGLPPSMQGRSYQNWQVRQPVRLRGLGLRSLLETSPLAFCGGVEMAVPCLTGENGICQSGHGEVFGAAPRQDSKTCDCLPEPGQVIGRLGSGFAGPQDWPVSLCLCGSSGS